MAYRIILRRDTAQNWESNNPVLLLGEPGYSTDTGILKIGDGANTWDNLISYSGATGATGPLPNFLSIDSSMIPSTGGVYDIGATGGYSWRDIYLSGNTIYIGDSKISASGSSIEMDTLIIGGPTADGGVIISATGGYLETNGYLLVGPTGSNGVTGPTGSNGVTGPTGPGGSAEITSITYSELYSLWDDVALSPGTYYLISDYQTCYDQPNFNSSGNAILTGNYKVSVDVEPLLVLATSTSGFAPTAFSTVFPKDKITYDIGFNQTEVTSSPAKGRITERIDEWENRTDYDHRSILFKRYTNYYYKENTQATGTIQVIENTGEVIGIDTIFTDYVVGNIIAIPAVNQLFFEIVSISSDTSMFVTGISIPPVSAGSNFYLAELDGLTYKQNNISIEYTEHPTFLFSTETIISNYIGDVASLRDWNEDPFLLSNNVFGEDVIGNRIGNDFRNNTFNSDVEHNVIGDQFENNTIYNSEDFTDNQISSNFRNNMIICEDFNDNVIGDNFNNNKIFNNSNFNDNLILVGFNNNMIYSTFSDNKLGDGVYDNDIRGEFTHNVIGNSFYNNQILSDFEDNQIGNEFYDNIIANRFRDNQIGNDFENNTIGDVEAEETSNFEGNVFGNNHKGNLFLLDFSDNTFKNYSFSNEFNGYAYGNTIGHYFGFNTIATQFIGNIIAHDYSDNTIGENFERNQIGSSFSNNNIADYFAYNFIGNRFQNNNIADDFGFGGNDERGNRIGNNFNSNAIGEYFYDNSIIDNFESNTVGDWFQFNDVKTGIYAIDFTTFLGNITGVTYDALSATDGTYTGISPTSSTGVGSGAVFTVTVSGGVVSGVLVSTPGIRYEIGNTVTLSAISYGGSNPLILEVSSISPIPSVYEPYNSTIFKRKEDQNRLSYFDEDDILTINDINK